MKRTFRLRTQMSIWMALLVLFQSCCLVIALSVSNVFYLLDSEAFRLFDNTIATRAQSFNSSVGQMVSNIAEETEDLDQKILGVAKEKQIGAQEIYRNDEAYIEVASLSAQTLVNLIQKNNISGAFLILNGSNSATEDAEAHSAVVIRNSAPEATNQDTDNYLLEVGPISVSQEHMITTSVNWNLDIHLDKDDNLSTAYYTKPIWAASEYQRSEIQRYGFWSPPLDILNDNYQAVTYTMPLLDEKGVGYGVLGIEISLGYLTQLYIPNIDLPYQNHFYAIAPVFDNSIRLDTSSVVGGPLAQVYLDSETPLSLSEVKGNTDNSVYSVELEGMGSTYCSVHTLELYSKNSPFFSQSWSLLGFVPQAVLHEGSEGVRSVLITSIIATTIVAFIAIFILTYLSSRRITGLSKSIGEISPNENITFEKTGMREIDELTSAIALLNDSVINASKTTSRILELTLLPIGAYEVREDAGKVTLTEYLCKILYIERGAQIDREEWDEYFAALTAEKSDNLENIYKFMHPVTEEILWLRILEQATETGVVGVVLDVTKDVEENRRLTRELDLDAMTGLYSRTAFKREAYAAMQEKPDSIGALIFADLDNLKYINDTYGHDVGDRMIIRAGELFKEFNEYGGIVSRMSGDEFAVYLHDYSSKEEALELIKDQFEHYTHCTLTTADGIKHKIRFSAGIAWFPDDSDNITDLLKLSDFAMYEAKNKDKGALFEFNKTSYMKSAFLFENREAINRLLEEKLIRFAFQPIVDLKTGEIYAYEALMRSLLDDFKSPMEILAVAATQSKLGQLERLVTLTAFEAIREHADELGDALVFMNSIPSQILSDEDHLYMERQFSDFFSKIVVEITESAEDTIEVINNKTQFYRDNGIQIAVDDFGSGYSNEVRILSIHPDIIKVDKELTQGIHKIGDKRELVANLLSFFQSKGIRIVAEGIEEKEDLEAVIEMGFDYVQGYYCARPSFSIVDLDERIKAELSELIKKHQKR